MKALKLVGVALLTMFSFVACDDPTNDPSDPTENPSVSEKRLARTMKYKIENGKEELCSILKFVYDTKDNVIEIIEKYDDGDSYSEKYVWDSDKSVTYYWDKEEMDEYAKYTLSDGKINNAYIREYKYYTGEPTLDENFCLNTYDKDGNLTECWSKWSKEDEYELENKYNWNNGKLTLIEDDYSVITLRYDNKTCKGFFPLFTEIIDMDFLWGGLFMAQPELAGIKTSYLPSKIIDGNRTISFEYELDAEGYVESCAVNEYYSYDHDYNGDGRDDYNSYDYLYEFIWE